VSKHTRTIKAVLRSMDPWVIDFRAVEAPASRQATTLPTYAECAAVCPPGWVLEHVSGRWQARHMNDPPQTAKRLGGRSQNAPNR